MTLKVAHFHLKSHDPAKTAKWWAENLGAKIPPEHQHGHSCRMDLHGVPFNVTPFFERQTRLQRYGLEHVCLSTDDLDNVVNKLQANGARLLEKSCIPSGELKGRPAFFFETPEGVWLEIIPVPWP